MTDRVIQQNITVPEGATVVTRIHIAKHLKDPWLRIFEDGMLTVITDPDMTGQDLRVLLYVLVNMEFENFFRESQAVMAEELGMKQPHISKSIRKLISKGWIRIDGQIGRRNIYRINPMLGFKSRAKNHSLLIEEWVAGQEAIA
jgi:hypothetical protein